MRAISLPISAIIVIALGLLVLVVLSAVFIKGGGGFTRTIGTQASIQECQSLCSQIQTWAMSYDKDAIDGVDNSTLEILGTFYQRCYDTGIMTNCTIQTMDGYTCYLTVGTNTMVITCP